MLADSELHESERIIITAVCDNIIASAAVENGLDEKQNEDPTQDERDLEMKDDDENETFFDGDVYNGEDKKTAKDGIVKEGSAMDDDYIAKNMEEDQLDAYTEHQPNWVQDVTGAITFLAVVPVH